LQVQSDVCYLIKLSRHSAEFIWSSTPYNPTEGSIDLRVGLSRLNPSELFILAENLGCAVKEDEIIPASFDSYNRLLIYACVRPTLRNSSKIMDLAVLVMNLSGWDSHYWASRFRERWWRYRSYRSILKAAKAFKLLFSLD